MPNIHNLLAQTIDKLNTNEVKVTAMVTNFFFFRHMWWDDAMQCRVHLCDDIMQCRQSSYYLFIDIMRCSTDRAYLYNMMQQSIYIYRLGVWADINFWLRIQFALKTILYCTLLKEKMMIRKSWCIFILNWHNYTSRGLISALG